MQDLHLWILSTRDLVQVHGACYGECSGALLMYYQEHGNHTCLVLIRFLLLFYILMSKILTTTASFLLYNVLGYQKENTSTHN